MQELLYNSRPLSLKKPTNMSVTFNIPRFITFEENQQVTVKNEQFNFTETYYYLRGKWSLVLKKHNDSLYLSKKKLA